MAPVPLAEQEIVNYDVYALMSLNSLRHSQLWSHSTLKYFSSNFLKEKRMS